MAYLCVASATCIASSRVGTSTRARAARVFGGAGPGQPIEDRQDEGGGLAGAGAGLADQVAALEQQGDGLALDWRGLLVAECGDGGHQRGLELERAESESRRRSAAVLSSDHHDINESSSVLSSASLSAVSQSPNRPPRPVKPAAAVSVRPPDAWWVEPVARIAVVVFLGLLVLDVVWPQVAGRVFWTVAVASLPLLFVDRRLPPLAPHLPAGLDRADPHAIRTSGPSPRRPLAAGARLRRRRWRCWSSRSGCDWSRTNGDGRVLAAFLVLLSAAAVAVGFVFTGKTWCNYVCPVSFVEKLYTEPRGLRDTPNSQCATCTACKPACPDINEENSYWKEILAPAKARAYYAFPGVVLAFYTYYYLQAGTWSYYFDGSWTNQVGPHPHRVSARARRDDRRLLLPAGRAARRCGRRDAGGRSRDQPADARRPSSRVSAPRCAPTA